MQDDLFEQITPEMKEAAAFLNITLLKDTEKKLLLMPEASTVLIAPCTSNGRIPPFQEAATLASHAV